MSDMEKFNPANLADQLKDKIRLDIAELMPDEQWKELVQKAIDELCMDREVEGYRGTVVRRSIVFNLVEEAFKERAKKVIEASKSKMWYGDELMEELVKRMFVEYKDELVDAVIKKFTQNIMSAIVESISNMDHTQQQQGW